MIKVLISMRISKSLLDICVFPSSVTSSRTPPFSAVRHPPVPATQKKGAETPHLSFEPALVLRRKWGHSSTGGHWGEGGGLGGGQNPSRNRNRNRNKKKQKQRRKRKRKQKQKQRRRPQDIGPFPGGGGRKPKPTTLQLSVEHKDTVNT